MKSWLSHCPKYGLDNVMIEALHWADTMRKLHSELHFGLSDNSHIEDHLHLFQTLYYRYIVWYVKFLLAYRSCQMHLDAQSVSFAKSDSCGILGEMNTCEW